MKTLVLASAVLLGLTAAAFAQSIYDQGHTPYAHTPYGHSPYVYAPYGYDAQQAGVDAYGMAITPNSDHPALTGGGSFGYNYSLTHGFQ